MNILGWQLHFRKRRTERASPFAAVLPKVRTMRENCDWLPVTPVAATVEPRRSRIATARRRITYRPIPHEETADSSVEQPRSRWLWMGGLIVLLTAGVVSAILLRSGHSRDARHVTHVYQYHYAMAPPPFLTDSTAISAAMATLTRSGLDQNWWTPVRVTNRNDNLAPDGSRDTYLVRTPPGAPNSGVVIFESERAGEPERIVLLQLEGAHLSATISAK
jgi:hypothetical protein